MSKAIIIGRNYTSRLGMIRAAGLAGCDVVVIQTNGTVKDIDASSKYVKKHLFAREPNRKLLIGTILSQAEKDEKVIILPVDDYAASTVDENIDILKERFLFPNVGMHQGAINKLMDKNLQKDIATKAGFPVAKGWVIHVQDGHFQIPDNIQYPCFPKPQVSFTGNKTAMKRCDTENELRNTISGFVKNFPNCSLLIEEFVNIEKEYATLGFSDGKNVIIPATIHLLESGRGRHKGVTLRGRILSTDIAPDFYERMKDFILSTGLVGLFDIDSYEAGGLMYFNELNLRFGASGYAMTSMGVNLPQLLINCLTNRPYDMNQSIQEEAVFVNEKVAYEDMKEGYISSWEYQKYLKENKIRFIYNEDDLAPYNAFLHIRDSKLKPIIKFILRRLGWRS